MKIPQGMTEAEVVEIIDVIGNKLASKFRFGYHETDDIKQQIFIFALKGLEKYDNVRPLENFLYIHVKNRLCNLKRDKFERLDKPCLTCPAYDLALPSQCAVYNNKENCELYDGWFRRNGAKKNLMNAVNITTVSDKMEESMRMPDKAFDDVVRAEIWRVVDAELPVDMRHDFKKFTGGISISKGSRTKLIEKIVEILKEKGIEVGN